MKRVLFFLLSFPLVYCMGMAVGKFYPTWKEALFFSKKGGLDLGFRPALYPSRNRPFVVIVAGKPSEYIGETVHSILCQKYDSFRIIYVEDGLSDPSLMHSWQQLAAKSRPLSLVKNEDPRARLAALVSAVKSCSDQEIVVIVPPGDLLAHEWVLDRLNRYYVDPSLWLSFGQYRKYPSLHRGELCKILREEWEEKGFRGYPVSSSFLQVFYAALFKKIDLSDLMYQGEILQVCPEFAYMIPMLEMAQDHFQCIEEILCLSRERAEDDPQLKQKVERHLRSLASYAPLHSLPQTREAL